MKREPRNHLPDVFWMKPQTATVTLTTKQVQDTMIATDGVVIANGRLWDIKTKRLAPGVYRVSLVLSDLTYPVAAS